VFTAGGQIGYNFQINQVVLGAEADINWFNDGVRTTGFNAPPNAADRALFYATGGLAYGKVEASTNASSSLGPITDLFAGDASGVRSGYTVGGGLEYALLNNVTIRAEYLYYNLGTATYAVAPANLFAAGEGLFITANQKFDGSLIRFGLNYKFGTN
jgi:outer membrane immunogenic protein